jgi:hypothetical protein
MNLKILLSPFLLCVYLAQPVTGQTIYGQPDCGEWLTNRSSYEKGWLLGYMSGLSSMHDLNKRPGDPLDKITSPNQIYIWMDNYCRKNPLQKIGNGGVSLFIELMNK